MKFRKITARLGCMTLAAAMTFSIPQMTLLAAESQELVGAQAEEGAPVQEAPEVTDPTPAEPVTDAPATDPTEPVTDPTEPVTDPTEPVTDPTEPVTEDPTDQTDTTNPTEPITEDPTDTTDPTEVPTTEGPRPGEIDDPDKKTQPGAMEQPGTITAPGTIGNGNGEDKKPEDHSDANANLTSNIIAGNGIYLDQLTSTYGLSFDDNIEEMMNEIEAEFKEWLGNPDGFKATNWQDVLAVYVLEQKQKNSATSFHIGSDAKEDLEKVFFRMNIRSTSAMANKLSLKLEKEIDQNNETYALTVEEYAALKNFSTEEIAVLNKYASTECTQLCAIVTASTGFVRAMVGEGVSEERVAITKAACSLVGKVGYFWGGKSYAIGWDSMWGTPMTVSASGSRSSGTSRGYGLDCSGFVCWSYYNGLGGSDGGIGNHTTPQWNSSTMVEGDQVQPGDMVFYNSPIAGDQNHVGLVIGKNEDGSILVAHCSSSRNGVVVGEAWSQGFKYVRSPLSLD